MPGDRVKYCFDASAFIEMQKVYPVEVFKTLWREVELCIADGCITAPGEVLKELAAKDDNIHGFVKRHKTALIFKNTPELLNRAAQITASYPKLIDELAAKPQADPFVVALAQILGNKVVTMERSKYNLQTPKIPDVCKQEAIPCIDLLEFFKERKISV